MKKLLILFVSAILLMACECPYKEECEKACRTKTYPTKGLTLYESDWYGTWQSSDLMFGNVEVKEFVIATQRPKVAKMTLKEHRSTSQYNRDYRYENDGKYIRFRSLYPDEYGQYDGPYTFRISEVYTCEVILEGGGKRYTIAHVSSCGY